MRTIDKENMMNEIKTWTVTKAGETVQENIQDIDQWVNAQPDIYVLARLNAIKTLIIA